MKFLERFLELINERDLSLSEIAKLTNLPRSTISSYINRKSIPSAIQLEVLSDFFKVSVDYLIGREDEIGNVNIIGSTIGCSEKELELLKYYRGMNDSGRDSIMATARNFYNLVVAKSEKAN